MSARNGHPATQTPLPEQKALDRALAKLRAMAPDEFFQTLVHAGIYTPDGRLTAPYTSDEPSAYRPTD
jgi:hypothetical protein